VFIGLLFFISHAEGVLTFTKLPSNPVYFMAGTDAILEWDYSVDNKTAEFGETSWWAYSRTAAKTVKLMLESGDGILKYNPAMPTEFRERVFKKGKATFVLKSVTFEDTIKVRCKLEDKSGNTEDSIISLVVTGPAFVHPAVQVAEVGTSTTFTCTAVNVPSQSFTWYYGQNELLINSSGSGSSELTIKGVSVSSTGYYFCHATANVDQPTTAKGFLQVLVQLSDTKYKPNNGNS